MFGDDDVSLDDEEACLWMEDEEVCLWKEDEEV